MDLSELRQEYGDRAIDVETVDPNPFKQFESWFKEASTARLLEPNAMILTTVNPDGRPSQRAVLLKYFDDSGFVFFTSYHGLHCNVRSKLTVSPKKSVKPSR